MANTLEDLLNAIDGYMAGNSAHSSNGPYLASKFSDLFDNIDSPLNVKDGPLKLIKEKFSTFAANIEKTNKSFEKLGAKVEKLYTPLFDLLRTIKKTTTRFDTLNKKLDSIDFTIAKHKITTTKNGANRTNTYLSKLVTLSGQYYKSSLKYSDKIANGVQSTNKKITTLITKLVNAQSKTQKADLRNDEVLNVHIKGIDGNVIRRLALIMPSYKNITYNKNYENRKTTEEGSVLGKVIKFVFGAVALVASVGFISKFLNTSPIGIFIKQQMKTVLKKLGALVLEYKEPMFGLIKEGLMVMGTGVKKFFVSTFNFYGMKDAMGSKFSGISTILTKSIFVTVSKVVSWVGNKLTFGVFGKFTKMFDGLLGGAGGIIAKPFAAMEKSFAGKGIIKLLSSKGAGFMAKLLKGLKFIPFIGALISAHSAYTRIKSGDITGGIIDIASGIASFFPGIGTGISIGLDVFNAFLDYKQESGKKSGKLAVISDWMSPVTDWFKDKFSYEKMSNMPVLGGVLRIGKAISTISNDPKQGMIDIISGLEYFTPIPFVGEFISFVNWIGSKAGVKGDVIPSYMKLDPTKIATDIVDFIGGLVSKVTNIIKDIFEKTKQLIGNGAQWTKAVFGSTSIGKITDEELRAKKEEERARRAARFSEPERRKVNDGIIVEPHSKDQVIAAKTGGPFDTALRDLSIKLDILINSVQTNTSASVSATIESAKGIMQTVANSAPKASAPAPFGGNDHIRAARLKSQGFIGG